MPVLKKGKFSLNLGFVSIGGEIDEEDRQIAWELYCEIVSRVAVYGKQDAQGNDSFDGEVLYESMSSLYAFFTEARALMRRYPVGKLGGTDKKRHLGFFIAALLETVLRPFLEKWQATYRHWWQHQTIDALSPFERQQTFASLDELQADWTMVRKFCRQAAADLVETHKLSDVTTLMEPGLQQLWVEETRRVVQGR